MFFLWGPLSCGGPRQLPSLPPPLKSGPVRPSVCTFVPFGHRTLLLWVCCCVPGGQDQISIDCCTAGGQQQPRRSTARSSKCASCYFVSGRRKLNTDLSKLLYLSQLLLNNFCVLSDHFNMLYQFPSDFWEIQ